MAIPFRSEIDDEVQRAIARLRGHDRAHRVLDGTATREGLAAYYTNVYDTVRMAPTLLRKTRDQLRTDGAAPGLIALFDAKCGEEDGHHHWLADDLRAIGMPLRDDHRPSPAAALYAAFHERVIALNGHAFLGTAWVLESLALHCAGEAARNLRRAGRIPGIGQDSEAGLSFLLRHNEEDVGHVQALGEAIERHVTAADAKHYVLLCARFTGCTYADMF